MLTFTGTDSTPAVAPSPATRPRGAAGGAGGGGRGGAGRLDTDGMFRAISKEIDDRRAHLVEMRALGQASMELELRMQREISQRARDLKDLDRLIGEREGVSPGLARSRAV